MTKNSDLVTLRAFSRVVSVLSWISGAFVLSVCLSFILGFYENDPELPALIPAVILCLCVGSIFFLPALFAGILARSVLKRTAKRRLAIITALLNIPIVFLAGFVFATHSLPVLYTIAMGLTALIFLFYSGYSVRSVSTLSRPIEPNRKAVLDLKD